MYELPICIFTANKYGHEYFYYILSINLNQLMLFLHKKIKFIAQGFSKSLVEVPHHQKDRKLLFYMKISIDSKSGIDHVLTKLLCI